MANGGVGYLFDHHDIAEKLGKYVGADYVLVGRLHKPSFLFSYLIRHLIRVKDSKLIGNYISEAKGPNIKLTVKTVIHIGSYDFTQQNHPIFSTSGFFKHRSC